MMDARTTLEHWLARGELQRVIAAGMALTAHGELPDLREPITLLSARHEQLLREQGDGTISREEARLERARIGKALLDWLRGLPPGLLLPPEIHRSSGPASGRRFWPWLLAGGLALSAAAGGYVWRQQQQQAKRLPATTHSEARPDAEAAVKPSSDKGKRLPEGPKRTEPKKQDTRPVPAGPTRAPVLDKVYATKEGMQRGLYQGQLSFRNTQTGQIFCCYEDAEDFSGGRAYVKANGVYFYIHKNGQRSED